MIFWDYWFSYIFKGYQSKGEKYSAHIYAVCVLTLLLSCNFLTVLFLLLSDRYLKSVTFKALMMGVFVALLSFNWFYFMRGDRYLKMVDRYQGMGNGNKRKGRIYFWSYFIGTIILLVLDM